MIEPCVGIVSESKSEPQSRSVPLLAIEPSSLIVTLAQSESEFEIVTPGLNEPISRIVPVIQSESRLPKVSEKWNEPSRIVSIIYREWIEVGDSNNRTELTNKLNSNTDSVWTKRSESTIELRLNHFLREYQSWRMNRNAWKYHEDRMNQNREQ